MSRAAPAAWVPEALYRRFIAHLPVLTVDIVVTCRGRVLLLRRAQPPSRGAWWFPGGRVRKREAVIAAGARVLHAETGLRAAGWRALGVMEYRAPVTRWRGVDIHTVSIVLLARVPDGQRVRLDGQSAGHRWARAVPRALDPRIRPFALRGLAAR